MSNLSFSQLKKNAKKDATALPQYKIAIMGDCATQHISTAIKGYGIHAGLGMKVFDADYNQFDAQLMDGASELYAFSPDTVLLYMCSEKLYSAFCTVPLHRRADFAQDFYEKIQRYWELIRTHIQTTILQSNFIMLNDGCFGNFANKTEVSFVYQLRKLNFLLMQGCQETKNVFLIDLDMLQSDYGRYAFCDSKLYYCFPE